MFSGNERLEKLSLIRIVSLMSTLVSFISVGGIIFAFFGDPLASLIGSLGWLLWAFSFRIIFNDTVSVSGRKIISRDLAEKGYCPRGYRGKHNPDDIHSRCLGAGYSKCVECISSQIVGHFSEADRAASKWREADLTQLKNKNK